MEDQFKMFLRMIKESMEDPAVESLEAEAKELEERIEKNQHEIEELQKQIAAFSCPEEDAPAGEQSATGEKP